jgi:hypothetical protein
MLGRPKAEDKNVPVQVRLAPGTCKQVDLYRKNLDSLPTRSTAVRHLVEYALAALNQQQSAA